MKNATIKYQAATLLLWLFLFSAQAFQIFSAPLSFDDSWFANYSKSWLLDPGYGLTLYERFVPFFNGFIGNTFVFVGAGTLATFFLGNAYWVPAFTNVIMLQSLLLLCVLALRNAVSDKAIFWKCAFFLLLTYLCCTSGDFIHRPERSFLWYSFHGDIASGLCTILAMLVLAGGTLTYKRLFLVGIIFGVASQIKLLILLPATALSLYACIHLYQRHSPRKALLAAILLGSGVAALQVIWFAYALYTLGYDQFVTAIQPAISTILKSAASTSPEAIDIHPLPWYRHIPIMLVKAWYAIGIFLLPVAAYYIVSNITYNRKNRPLRALEYFSTALMVGGVVQVLWWLIFPMPLTRYLVPAIMYIMTGLVILLIQRRARYPYGLYILTVVTMIGRGDDFSLAIFREGFRTHQSRDDLLKAKETLLELKKQGYRLASCGLSFELEYLLPGNRNFVHCNTLKAGQENVGVAFTYVKPGILTDIFYNAFVLPIQPPSWIKQQCVAVVPSPYFEVWRCDKAAQAH